MWLVEQPRDKEREGVVVRFEDMVWLCGDDWIGYRCVIDDMRQ